jgi:hypothetical protein
MSEETAETTSTHSEPAAHNHAPVRKKNDAIIIRMWPKTPVLYPTALVALVCSLVAHFAGSSELNDYPFQNESIEQSVDDATDGEPTPSEAGAASMSPVSVLPAQTAGDVADDAGSTPATAATFAEKEELAKKRIDRNLAVIFLVVLFFTLFAICVDLDVRWAIIYLSIIVITALLLWILQITTGMLPSVFGWLDQITPMANAQMYFGVFAVWLLLMVISFVVTRFHYVKVEAQEVIVVGGMLERQQRFDTMRMRYTKEIHDVMEYYLPFVRSGRLIFSFPEQSEAVIIDNVINIKKVAKQLDDIGGSGSDHHHKPQ